MNYTKCSPGIATRATVCAREATLSLTLPLGFSLIASILGVLSDVFHFLSYVLQPRIDRSTI
ncbi:hypothetical protein H257_06514 [Aphanomyces astaci]|uniref:Uncharacterized protein n=1 Tax=Aphanomyces astaci TaxID=112090 RepID=W4GKF3_APHAT|nr:hypothetical protein H257_06514 [Aphanomyces astaci]ETV80137.1 hypothetical protein H257_06514 [Aphanomyces astaci]|eukprot:XP_009830061.1 hypothetical protein H257_06514 [Aphanomyces astaci]